MLSTSSFSPKIIQTCSSSLPRGAGTARPCPTVPSLRDQLDRAPSAGPHATFPSVGHDVFSRVTAQGGNHPSPPDMTCDHSRLSWACKLVRRQATMQLCVPQPAHLQWFWGWDEGGICQTFLDCCRWSWQPPGTEGGTGASCLPCTGNGGCPQRHSEVVAWSRWDGRAP